MNEKRIEIIYSDKSVAVCIKPSGVSSESAEGRCGMPDLIAAELKADYVGTVHRLDTVTEGLMIYSLDKKVTGKLTEAIAARDTEKEYLAIVHGKPADNEGEMRDLLFRDAGKNKTYVVKRERRGVREAILTYSTIETKETDYGTLSLVRVKLVTGRTHQIRAQFASRSMPLVGDGKYGAKDNAPQVALYSARISFTHPLREKRMEFERMPNGMPWELFNIRQNSDNKQETDQDGACNKNL